VNGSEDGVIEGLRQNLAREEEEFRLLRLTSEVLGLNNSRILERKQRVINMYRESIQQHELDAGGRRIHDDSREVRGQSRAWVKPGMFSSSPKVAVRQYLEHREKIDHDTSPASIANEVLPNLIAAMVKKKSTVSGESVLPNVGSISSAISWGDVNGKKTKGKKYFRYKKTSPNANDGWVQLKHWPAPPDWSEAK
jgi:hypothetical protein